MLDAALQREIDLIGKLKSFNTGHRAVAGWVATSMVLVRSHDYGLGVPIREVQQKIDTLNARYTSKVPINAETVQAMQSAVHMCFRRATLCSS